MVYSRIPYSETISLMLWTVTLSFATVLIALGADLGYTLTTFLAYHGYQDTLMLRAQLIGIGIGLFVLVYIFADEPDDDPENTRKKTSDS